MNSKDWASILVKKDTKAQIDELKDPDETFDNLLKRMMKFIEENEKEFG